jgi:hypothetical protein
MVTARSLRSTTAVEAARLLRQILKRVAATPRSGADRGLTPLPRPSLRALRQPRHLSTH